MHCKPQIMFLYHTPTPCIKNKHHTSLKCTQKYLPCAETRTKYNTNPCIIHIPPWNHCSKFYHHILHTLHHIRAPLYQYHVPAPYIETRSRDISLDLKDREAYESYLHEINIYMALYMLVSLEYRFSSKKKCIFINSMVSAKSFDTWHIFSEHDLSTTSGK